VKFVRIRPSGVISKKRLIGALKTDFRVEVWRDLLILDPMYTIKSHLVNSKTVYTTLITPKKPKFPEFSDEVKFLS